MGACGGGRRAWGGHRSGRVHGVLPSHRLRAGGRPEGWPPQLRLTGKGDLFDVG